MSAAGALVLGSGSISWRGTGAAALTAAAARGGEMAPRTIERFDPADYLELRGLRPLSRASLLACVAAAGALRHPEEPPGERDRRAVVLGTRWASLEPLFQFERSAATDGPSLVSPSQFPNVVVNAHAGYLGILFGFAGPNVTLCGPSAGLEAVGEAAEMLSLRRADHALAGGVEALSKLLLDALAGGDGEAGPEPPGEGAGLLLLGREAAPGERAEARVGGFASAHLGGREPRDARSAVLGRALEEAGVRTEEIGAVWFDGADPPGSWPPERLHALATVAGTCGAAGGALAAAAAADAVATNGKPALAAALPPIGTQCALVLTPP